MRFSQLILPALGASVLAAPSHPKLNLDAARPGSIEVLSDYFNLLADKVQEHRWMSSAPVCDLSNAKMSTLDGPDVLPGVTPGLTLKHVVIGRGTQNYTCDAGNATAAPSGAGALAALFNATCIAATYPDLLDMLPRVALQFNLTAGEAAPGYFSPDAKLAPTNLLTISGHHYFRNKTTPLFDLDSPAMSLGQMPTASNSSAPAPADAPTGQQGEAAVAWLKLLARWGTTGDLQEVYRVQTAGGSPPKTCAGMPASFEVQYAAQYWFYEGKPGSLKFVS